MQSISEGREIVGVLVCSRDGPNKKTSPCSIRLINNARFKERQRKSVKTSIGHANLFFSSFFFSSWHWQLFTGILLCVPIIKKVYFPDKHCRLQKVGLEVSKFWNKSAHFSINFLSPYRAVYDEGLLYMWELMFLQKSWGMGMHGKIFISLRTRGTFIMGLTVDNLQTTLCFELLFNILFLFHNDFDAIRFFYTSSTKTQNEDELPTFQKKGKETKRATLWTQGYYATLVPKNTHLPPSPPPMDL